MLRSSVGIRDPFSTEVELQCAANLNDFTVQNFHDVFGINGCQLHCSQRHALQVNNSSNTQLPRQKKAAWKAKVKLPELIFDDSSYFTWGELTASVAQGCGSCAVLGRILESIFPHSQLDKHLYSISTHFTIKRKAIDPQIRSEAGITEVDETPLFQPRGNQLGPPVYQQAPELTASKASPSITNACLRAISCQEIQHFKSQ